MSREINSTSKSEIQKSNLNGAFLAYFDFPSGEVRVWTGVGDLTWNGNTYKGIGAFGGFSEIDENMEGKATGITFTLTGIDSTVRDPALEDKIQSRDCNLWFATLTDTGTLLGEPFEIFPGLMDVIAYTDGTTSTIELTAENALLNRHDKNRRSYTDVQQKTEFPGDESFSLLSSIVNKAFAWGRRRERSEETE